MAYLKIVNDFRNGMIDEQFSYRPDLSIANTSASLLENVVVRHAGGLKQREGVMSVASYAGAKRLIPFIIDVSTRYVIVLKEKSISFLQYIEGTDSWTFWNNAFESDYLDSELREIKYAQDNTRLVLVHSNHPPLIIQTSESSTHHLSVSEIVLDTSTDRVDETDSGEEVEFQYDYAGLFTENNFPSVVTFCANRLWFACSKENPGRLWASQAFKYNNFQDFAYYKVVDETVTTENYLQAIENYTSSVTDNGDGTETRINKTVSADGYVVITTGKYDKESGELIGEEKVETFNYTKPAVTWQEIPREDSAMILDIASTVNETICWLGYVDDLILVGTTSSEWAMDYSINPHSAYIYKTSSYGSYRKCPMCYGARNIFYSQTGGKRIRSLVRSSDQTGFIDLTYQNESILEDKPIDMAWQRVPDPRLYVVLADGTVRVLCYDPDYSLNAWVKWTFPKQCIAVCVADSEDGQDVFFLFYDGSVGMLQDGLYKDFSTDFETNVIANYAETIDTMFMTKKSYSLYVCAGGTKFVANNEGLPLRKPQSYDHRMIRLEVSNNTDFRDGQRIQIKGVAGEPFNLFALLTVVEVY